MTPVHDERMNIGAKGLSGEAYKCHTFWDTEMFLSPSWLYTEPEVARRLLRYRYLTLPKAKEKAAQYGCEGALFHGRAPGLQTERSHRQRERPTW